MKSTQFVEPSDIQKPTNEKPVVIKSWDEFRKTGLFLIINQLLHAFGWALILFCDENNSVTSVSAGRVVFRGFDEQAQSEDYTKVAEYLNDNSVDLLNEAKS